MIDLLTRHFANDHITEADLEDRLHRAYLATNSAELDAVMAGLPALPPTEADRPPSPVTGGERIAATFSGQERKIGGVVPRELQLQARAGYVELDLTRASFAPGLTTIDVRAFMGYVEIRFPAGVRVESNGRALFGYFSLKGGGGGGGGGGEAAAEAASAPDAPSIVRVTGRALFGYAECLVATRRRRLEGRAD